MNERGWTESLCWFVYPDGRHCVNDPLPGRFPRDGAWGYSVWTPGDDTRPQLHGSYIPLHNRRDDSVKLCQTHSEALGAG
jgi:hypothetical protein